MSSPQEEVVLPPWAFDDRSPTIIGVVVFCLLWSTTLVGLRIWTRKKILNELGWDDYACIAGLVSCHVKSTHFAMLTS